ncbi:MAG: transcription antitermination factor NusB [Acidimicrobiia bacterium]
MPTDPLGSRRESRERALSLLYEADAKGEAPAVILAALPVPPDEFTASLVGGVGEHQPELDGLIRRFSKGWSLERMPVVDRALLRIALFELGHLPAVPTAVVISEAVDLAKRYSTDDSGRFVNGMLAAIAAELRPTDGTRPEVARPGA